MNVDTLRSDGRWACLDGKLTAAFSADFIIQFKEMMSCDKARRSRSVVYLWCTKTAVPRVTGKSNIIYIGQTIQSLFDRHYKWAKVEGNDYNWPRYKKIIELYGPIRVYYSVVSNPKEQEAKLLKEYYLDHCEYPPINRASR